MKALLARAPSVLSSALEEAWDAWSRFWFESAKPANLIWFRRVFGALCAVYILTRTPDLVYFYSNSGILPIDLLKQFMTGEYRRSVFRLYPSDTAIIAGHALLVTSLISLAMGFFSRTSAVVAIVLHVSFLHRNPAVSYGIDSIMTFFLLGFCIADARCKSELASVALRLGQIQVCIIYLYSGLEKLKGTRWWSGEAVWDAVANVQQSNGDYSWLSGFPLVVALATWSTLLWELYFPALVWNRKLRYPGLLFGVALHLGIGFSMNLPYFALLMIASYLLFLPEAWMPLRKKNKFSVWKKTQGSSSAADE